MTQPIPSLPDPLDALNLAPGQALPYPDVITLVGMAAAIVNRLLNNPHVTPHLENLVSDVRPDGFTFRADLKPPPQVEPDAITAIGT